MPSPPLPRETVIEFYNLVEKLIEEGFPAPGVILKGHTGAVREALIRLGRNPSSSTTFLRACERSVGYLPNWKANERKTEKLSYPVFHDPEMPIEELLDAAERQFERRWQAHSDREWMEIGVQDGPFLTCFMGDPHLDDNGCNWKILRRDIGLIKKTPRAYACNLGDWTNNWSGRLSQKIYPYQERTRPQAWRLVEWLFKEVPWWILLKGNHDMWSLNDAGGDPLDYICSGPVPLQTWSAKCVLKFDSGKEIFIELAHDFKGHSQWNILHGIMKRAKFSSKAAIYAQGDKHTSAIHQEEDPERDNIWTGCMASGYKWIDPHAQRLGYSINKRGGTIGMVIDPRPEVPSVQPFYDLEMACKYQEYLLDGMPHSF